MSERQEEEGGRAIRPGHLTYAVRSWIPIADIQATKCGGIYAVRTLANNGTQVGVVVSYPAWKGDYETNVLRGLKLILNIDW